MMSDENSGLGGERSGEDAFVDDVLRDVSLEEKERSVWLSSGRGERREGNQTDVDGRELENERGEEEVSL